MYLFYSLTKVKVTFRQTAPSLKTCDAVEICCVIHIAWVLGGIGQQRSDLTLPFQPQWPNIQIWPWTLLY
jgi:hypothetical protein